MVPFLSRGLSLARVHLSARSLAAGAPPPPPRPNQNHHHHHRNFAIGAAGATCAFGHTRRAHAYSRDEAGVMFPSGTARARWGQGAGHRAAGRRVGAGARTGGGGAGPWRPARPGVFTQTTLLLLSQSLFMGQSSLTLHRRQRAAAAASSGNSPSVRTTTTKSGDEEERESRIAPLGFISGSAMLPSVGKENGGEDSYFISDEDGLVTVGVADGVGGWADMGVDAGLYARQLMYYAAEAAKEEGIARGDCIAEPNPARIMYKAASQTDAKGSSTACIVCLNGSTLTAANLGDSGFLVVRGRKAIFKSPPQQHSFNFPFQVSSVPKYSDDPRTADTYQFDVMPGDTIVLGTDGLFDNLYPEEIVSMVYEAKGKDTTASEVADMIADTAHEVAVDRGRDTPFAYEARKAGYPNEYGGKMDDVTVIVTYVVTPAKL